MFDIKISIITVVKNNKETIARSIDSVLSQTYKNIEYIVIDGCSTDGTIEIANSYKDKIDVFISEPDNGIYDALNKGVFISTGEFVTILHSDDIFFDKHSVLNMAKIIQKNQVELCFSNMGIVNNSNTVLRYYMAGYFKPWMLRMGWLPPHPTCFIKKSLFNEFGPYSLKYSLAGDFDFLVRIFFKRDIKWIYLDQITVIMKHGGASNSGYKSKILAAKEIRKSLKDNHVFSLFFFQLGRYFIRLLEFIIKPKINK